MAAVTICSDFEAQENKVCQEPSFPLRSLHFSSKSLTISRIVKSISRSQFCMVLGAPKVGSTPWSPRIQNTVDVEKDSIPTPASGHCLFLIRPFWRFTPRPCLVGGTTLIIQLAEEEPAHGWGGLVPEHLLPAALPACGSCAGEGPEQQNCCGYWYFLLKYPLIHSHIRACSMCQPGIHRHHYLH